MSSVLLLLVVEWGDEGKDDDRLPKPRSDAVVRSQGGDD